MMAKVFYFMRLVFAIVFFSVFGALKAFALPEKYEFDKFHTAVTWKADHFGFSKPSGKFTDVTGYVIIDEQNIGKSYIDAKIAMNSLETGFPEFNNHLKTADFFNVPKFDHAYFKSKKVVKKSGNTAEVEGVLTLLGVSKPVTLEVKLNKSGQNPMLGVKTMGFSAKALVKRSEFGMKYALPGVADEVEIEIEAELNLVSNEKTSK